MTTGLYIGLISGTSRDGVDAVLAELDDDTCRLLKTSCNPYPDRIRNSLDSMLATARRPTETESHELDLDLADFFAGQCQHLLAGAGIEASAVEAIGSHGQTVWHEPGGTNPVSLQLGSGERIAAMTGITTVADFRGADVAAGGQGAPLAPLMHQQLFESGQAVLNLGGIANLTLMHPDGSLEGYDCGPANCLMDAWILRHQGRPFDESGSWAASGHILPELLEDMLAEPWFALPPPKSTGLEMFNSRWLDQHLEKQSHRSPQSDHGDIQRTLAELTARTVADCLTGDAAMDRLLVCGGGVHNQFLMSRLTDLLAPMKVESTASPGVDPDWIEASLFAWLARERIAQRTQDTGPVTGARHPVLLGTIYQP